MIVYPDLDMVIVTCAGNNELFQNNVMLDLIRDAFPQEYQASEYALPENPAEYHKLIHLVHSLSHGPSCMPQIRRGGWAKKSGYSRSHAIYPKYVRLLKDLDGKCYNINPASVGLFPLIIQVFHNNMTNGIRQISFQYDKINCPDKFYIHFLEGEEHCTLTVSFDRYIDNLITLHGETYLVAVKCEYTTDADHALGTYTQYGLSGRSHEPKALFTFQKQRINSTLVRVSRERAYFRRSVFHHRGDDEASTLRTLSRRKRNAVPGTFNGRYHRTNYTRDIS